MENINFIGDLILLRGLPGSGKTTLGDIILTSKQPHSVLLSADDFFTNTLGEYNFDATKLKDAHNDCQFRCESMMKIGLKKIVVANTFTQEWEMKPYFKMAEKHNYRVHSLIVENRHDGKNVHNVPHEKIEQMKNRFEIIL